MSEALYSRVLAVMYPDNAEVPDPPYVPPHIEKTECWFNLLDSETCPVCCELWDGFNPWDEGTKDLHHTFRFKCDHPICTDCHKGMKDSGRTMRCPLCRAEEDKSITFPRCKACGKFGHKTRASKECPLNSERLMRYILTQEQDLIFTREDYHHHREHLLELIEENKILKNKLDAIVKLIQPGQTQ